MGQQFHKPVRHDRLAHIGRCRVQHELIASRMPRTVWEVTKVMRRPLRPGASRVEVLLPPIVVSFAVQRMAGACALHRANDVFVEGVRAAPLAAKEEREWCQVAAEAEGAGMQEFVSEESSAGVRCAVLGWRPGGRAGDERS